MLLTPLQYRQKLSVVGSHSHTCLLLLLGISYDIPHGFFYISLPNKGTELAIFDFLDNFSNFKTK